MSEFQQKDNEGALFANDRKETEKHPDYKGDALIGGTQYYLSAWINTSKNGVKYMKTSYTPKEQASNAVVQQIQPAAKPFKDNDIPF
jgi:hypothetical protein